MLVPCMVQKGLTFQAHHAWLSEDKVPETQAISPGAALRAQGHFVPGSQEVSPVPEMLVCLLKNFLQTLSLQPGVQGLCSLVSTPTTPQTKWKNVCLENLTPVGCRALISGKSISSVIWGRFPGFSSQVLS